MISVVFNCCVDNNLLDPKAKPIDGLANHYLDNLFALIKLQAPYPYAAFDGLNTHTAQYRYWLKATPIHLHTSHNDAYLTNYHDLQLSAVQAQQLIAELSQLFVPQEAQFYAVNPQCWVVNLNQLPQINTVSLALAHNKSLLPLLPTGVAATHWRQLFTEIQMLFYTSKVNQIRENHGQPIISGLWFWGEGELSERMDIPYAKVISDDVRLLRWCAKSGVASYDLAHCETHTIRQLVSEGNSLIAVNNVSLANWQLLSELRQSKLGYNLYLNDQAFKIKPRRWW